MTPMVKHWKKLLERAQTKDSMGHAMRCIVKNKAVTSVGLQPVIPTLPPRVKDIVKSVAKKHGVEIEAMFLRTRNRQACYARFEAMARIRNEIPKASLHMIGKWSGGYDHTTVINGIRRFHELSAEGVI